MHAWQSYVRNELNAAQQAKMSGTKKQTKLNKLQQTNVILDEFIVLENAIQNATIRFVSNIMLFSVLVYLTLNNQISHIVVNSSVCLQSVHNFGLDRKMTRVCLNEIRFSQFCLVVILTNRLKQSFLDLLFSFSVWIYAVNIMKIIWPLRCFECHEQCNGSDWQVHMSAF